MNCLVVLLGLLAFTAAVQIGISDDTAAAIEFQKFVTEHGKKYFTADEQGYRFRVFKSNLQYINEHNKGDHGFTLDVNEFADMTNEEFRAKFLGSFAKTSPAPKQHVAKGSIPSSVDWRTKGAVTPVKNQGSCGSCWSFSTTGSVEGAWFLAKGKLVSLSEQNLVDCSTAQGNNGCGGGLMDNAFNYIISNKGIDTEASYPYTGRDGQCRYNPANSAANISSYHDIASGSESDLASAVAQQPVSVAIDAGKLSFQFYRSGVYYEARCSSTQLDHGVLAVGYGTDSGKDYWLVKNSWGASWGQKGYIWMSRNKNNNCGIATAASYPIV